MFVNMKMTRKAMTHSANAMTIAPEPARIAGGPTTTDFPDYRCWHDVVERIAQLEEMIVEARHEHDDCAALAIVSLAEELRTQRRLLQRLSGDR